MTSRISTQLALVDVPSTGLRARISKVADKLKDAVGLYEIKRVREDFRDRYSDTDSSVGEVVETDDLGLMHAPCVAEGLTYLRAIRPSWVFLAAGVLRASPTMAEFFSFINTNPDSTSEKLMSCCGLRDVFYGAYAGAGFYDIDYTSNGGDSELFAYYREWHRHEPRDDFFLRTRLGDARYLDFCATDEATDARETLPEEVSDAFARCKQTLLDGSESVVFEIATSFNRYDPESKLNPEDAHWAKQKHYDEQWKSDLGLGDGNCYEACFTPGIREAVRAHFGGEPPTVEKFFVTYLAAYVRNWTLPGHWYLRLVERGRYHLDNAYSRCDPLSIGTASPSHGTVGHRPRCAGGPIPGFRCGACRGTEAVVWQWCGQLDGGFHPARSLGESNTGQGGMIMIKLTRAGNKDFGSFEGLRHVVPSGTMALVRPTADLSCVSDVPHGVKAVLVAVGGHCQEVIVPPGINTYVGGSWVKSAKPLCVISERIAILGFSGVDMDVPVFLRGRAREGWVSWHHVNAGVDVGDSFEQFYYGHGVKMVIYSGLSAEPGVADDVKLKKALSTGSSDIANFSNTYGRLTLGASAAVISPVGQDICVGDVVLKAGSCVGLGPRIQSVEVGKASMVKAKDAGYRVLRFGELDPDVVSAASRAAIVLEGYTRVPYYETVYDIGDSE